MGRNPKSSSAHALDRGLQLHEDGEYRYRFMQKGKLFTGNTHLREEKAAREWVKDLKDQIRLMMRGRISLPSEPEPAPSPALKKMTLGQLLDRWVATKVTRSKKYIQPTAGSIRRHFQALLDTAVEEITTQDLNEAIEVYLHSKGLNHGNGGTPCRRDHTARGAKRLLQRFRNLVSFGRREHCIGDTVFTLEYPKLEVMQKHTLPLQSMAKFLTLVDRASNPHFGMAARLMLWLGLREDEVLNLAWEDINWRKAVIVPNKTKSSDGCEIMIPPELKQYLWNHKDRRAFGLLLPSSRKSKDGVEVPYQAGVTSSIIEAANWKIIFDELSEDDVQRLFKVIDKHPHRDVRTLTRLMLEFGFPESMARSVRWEHLDLERGIYSWPVLPGEPRTITVPDRLSRYLQDLPGPRKEGRVVMAPMGRHRGSGRFRHREATKTISAAWKALRLPRLTPHRLRASFATIHAYELETNVFRIQELMRHKDISTTLHYINSNHKANRQAQESWPQIMPLENSDPFDKESMTAKDDL